MKFTISIAIDIPDGTEKPTISITSDSTSTTTANDEQRGINDETIKPKIRDDEGAVNNSTRKYVPEKKSRKKAVSKQPLLARSCLNCGDQFFPRRSNQLYHNTKCKDAFYRKSKLSHEVNELSATDKLSATANDVDISISPLPQDSTYQDRVEDAKKRRKRMLAKYGVPNLDHLKPVAPLNNDSL